MFVYQAYCNNIANWVLEHQTFEGPNFNPKRMTWIKPSFVWVLYRSGYGKEHNHQRILKVKISHVAFASILKKCARKKSWKSTVGSCERYIINR